MKKRLGLTDDSSDSSDDSSNSNTDVTPTPSQDDRSDNDDQNSDNNGNGDNDNPSPTDTPQNPDDGPSDSDGMIATAQQYIGQSLSALEGACGSPQGSDYEDDPETGKMGLHYYSNFTVSTTVDENGNEIVSGIW